MKILIGPEELPDKKVRLSALDWLREWQQGVATARESGRLYDEEATRASSAGPFVLPVGRGSTEGAEVGQRLSVLESQILRDLEGGDQRSVKRRTSGVKGFALSAVPTPPLPYPGEEVVEQSREAVTPTPQDRKSLLRVKLEGVRAAFNATKPRKLHHGGRKDVLRTMAIRAMTFVAEREERERKRTRKGTHTLRQQERKKKSFSSASSVATNESDTSSSETARGMGSRSKIMRAVEDRPGELMMSFGDQILQYVTDETKMRPSLEERGRMIDVANLASKYYATLRAEAREKINPGQHAELRTLAEALDSLWTGQLGRAGDILAQRFRAVEANSVERIGWLRARFIEALPPSQITSVPVAMRAEIDKQARNEFKLSGKGVIGWQTVKGTGKEGWKGMRAPLMSKGKRDGKDPIKGVKPKGGKGQEWKQEAPKASGTITQHP